MRVTTRLLAWVYFTGLPLAAFSAPARADVGCAAFGWSVRSEVQVTVVASTSLQIAFAAPE
jgi:hypothetical protein